MAHTHDVYDMENHFEINGSSRFIKETSETKLVVVQGDHKSEVLTFKMPRYIDGHDMTLCNKIRIHYINLDTKTNNKSADVYEVTDLTLCEECEDVLTFTWTIEAPATKYSGTLSFLVKFECTEGENVLYQWNTAKYVSVNVLAGIDNSEEFVEKYSNVLEEWYNELTNGADSIEELNQQAIAEIELAKEDAKEGIQGKADTTMSEMSSYSANVYNNFKNGVDEKASRTLASIPDDYSALNSEVDSLEIIEPIRIMGAVLSNLYNKNTVEIFDGKFINNYDGSVNENSDYLYFKLKLYSGKKYMHNFSVLYGVKVTNDSNQLQTCTVSNDYGWFEVPALGRKIVDVFISLTKNSFDYANGNEIIICGDEEPTGNETNKVYLKGYTAEYADKISIKPYQINSVKLLQKMPLYLFDGVEMDNYFDAEYMIANSTEDEKYANYYHTPYIYLPSGTYTINECYSYTLMSKDGAVGETVTIGSGYKPATFTVTEDNPYISFMIYCIGGVKGVEYLRNISIQKGDTAASGVEPKYHLENFNMKGYVKYFPSHWDGKRYAAIGDSITYGYAPKDDEEGIAEGSKITPNFAEYVADSLNMELLNVAMGGYTVRTTLSNNRIDAIKNENFTPDVVTILLGANDYQQVPLGTIDDVYESYDNCSFYAGMREIVRQVQTEFPLATIVLLGSPKNARFNEETLAGFEQAKKDIANEFDVLYCDLHNGCGFNINNPDIVDLFRLDDVHPNHRAHKILGSRLTGFIASH